MTSRHKREGSLQLERVSLQVRGFDAKSCKLGVLMQSPEQSLQILTGHCKACGLQRCNDILLLPL